MADSAPSLRDLFRVFGRIGCLSFGGPAAQIALMEDELVTRRDWLSQDTFLRALSFCMLLPGPEAMQLATYAGWRLHGVWGGLLAGTLFVAPGAAVIFGLAALYISYGDQPVVREAFLGVQATVIMVVVAALGRLSQKALNGREGRVIAALAFAAIFALGLPFPVIVFAAGAYGALTVSAPPTRDTREATPPTHTPATPQARRGDSPPSPTLLATLGGLWGLPLLGLWFLGGGFLLAVAVFFSQLAVVTFGGAYAVLGYMTQTVVQDEGWITTEAMIAALGLAETTPGPLILVTQFVGVLAGHAVGGWPMAVAAGLLTLWVTFLPCFLWIFAGAPYLERLTNAPRVAGALRAVTAAVVGVIANLSLWFALHVIFAEVSPVPVAMAELPYPDWTSLRPLALLYGALAALLLFRAGRGIVPTLLIVTGLALAVALAT
ncbi:MAG: chromate efflux transporter [Pseudomonadota bacterium]